MPLTDVHEAFVALTGGSFKRALDAVSSGTANEGQIATVHHVWVSLGGTSSKNPNALAEDFEQKLRDIAEERLALYFDLSGPLPQHRPAEPDETWAVFIWHVLAQHGKLARDSFKRQLAKFIDPPPTPDPWYNRALHPLSVEAKLFTQAVLEHVSKLAVDQVHEDDSAIVEKLAEVVAPEFARAVAAGLGSDAKLTSIQERVVDRLRAVIEDRALLIITAPTGTGKSTIGQVCLGSAVDPGNANAVQLVPLRALASQAERDWTDLLAGTSYETALEVLPVSSDYPEHDAPVKAGEFDIACAINESIAAMLAGGHRPLAKTIMVLVDELQYLADPSDRAFRLEALLTQIKLMDGRPAIVGMSATLDRNHAEPLVKWLGDQGKDTDSQVIATTERTVALDANILGIQQQNSANTWLKVPDAHRANPTTEPEVVSGGHTWLRGGGAPAGRPDPSKGYGGVPGRLTAQLVEYLLAENAEHRIIVFVNSRSLAESLAGHIGAHLAKAFGRTEKADPWETGRFASKSSLNNKMRAGLLDDEFSDIEAEYRDAAKGWLRGGVGAHTGAMTRDLRELIEQEFRDLNGGLLRVLCATDTLSIGVNLLADHVIVLSPFTRSGDRLRLVEPAEMANKVGRAGRPPQTRGSFWLIAAAREPLVDEGDARQVATAKKMCERYVLNRNRFATISSSLAPADQDNGKSAARLVLTILAGDSKRRFKRAEFTTRVDEILAATLATHTGVQLPTAPEVQKLLAIPPQLINEDSSQRIGLTGLGRALGQACLARDMVDPICNIAQRAEDSAGLLELLYITAQTPAVVANCKWPTMPKPEGAEHALFDRLSDYSSAYFTAGQFHDDELFGSKAPDVPARAELAAMGGPRPAGKFAVPTDWDPTDSQSTAQVNALLRAVIAFEWMRGQSFKAMKSRLELILKVNERSEDRPNRAPRRKALRLHRKDVEILCDQIGMVLVAAAGAVDGSGKGGHQLRLRLRELGACVAAGVPAGVLGTLNLRLPGLGRERILHALSTVTRSEWTHEAVAAALPEYREGLTLAGAERIRSEILNDHRGTRATEVPVPGQGYDLRSWLSVVAANHAVYEEDQEDHESYIEAWFGTLKDFDIADITRDGNVIRLGSSLEFVFMPSAITSDDLESLATPENPDLFVVAWRGCTDAARDLLAGPDAASCPAVLKPGHLAAALATVAEVEPGQPIDPDALRDQLRQDTPGDLPPPPHTGPIPAFDPASPENPFADDDDDDTAMD